MLKHAISNKYAAGGENKSKITIKKKSKRKLTGPPSSALITDNRDTKTLHLKLKLS
jgi:hypothetical protein